MNYLQLGRNLKKYAHRVDANAVTYVYDAKGISDFKQLSPIIYEELTNTFRGVERPVLEIFVKKAKNSIGVLTIKNGKTELSQDEFVLKSGENIEDYLPITQGCLKKIQFDKVGLIQVGRQNDLLGKMINELILGLRKPVLEFWTKKNDKYCINNIILRDGNKKVLNGFFSRTNEKDRVEKYRFTNEKEYISGGAINWNAFARVSERLPQRLVNRLWMLDERTKCIIKRRFGIDCSPKKPNEIAKEWNITGARIREIVSNSMGQMENADTYNKILKADLDDLGYLLSDEERYRIYKHNSIIDTIIAKCKIKVHEILMQG